MANALGLWPPHPASTAVPDTTWLWGGEQDLSDPAGRTQESEEREDFLWQVLLLDSDSILHSSISPMKNNEYLKFKEFNSSLTSSC